MFDVFHGKQPSHGDTRIGTTKDQRQDPHGHWRILHLQRKLYLWSQHPRQQFSGENNNKREI